MRDKELRSGTLHILCNLINCRLIKYVSVDYAVHCYSLSFRFKKMQNKGCRMLESLYMGFYNGPITGGFVQIGCWM